MLKLLAGHPSQVNKHHLTIATTMADPNHLGPQPDTTRMVQYFHGVADELAKLLNVPTLAEGNTI